MQYFWLGHLIIKPNRVSLPSSRHNVCSVTARSFIPSVCHSSVQLMPRQHFALPSALGLSSKTCSQLIHAKKCMKYAWHAPEGTMVFLIPYFKKSNQGFNIVISVRVCLPCQFWEIWGGIGDRARVSYFDSCFCFCFFIFCSCVWKVVYFNKCNTKMKKVENTLCKELHSMARSHLGIHLITRLQSL